MMNRSRIAEKTETDWDDLVYTKINSVAIVKGLFSDINVDQTKDVSAVYDFCHAGLCKNGANCTNTGNNHTNADYSCDCETTEWSGKKCDGKCTKLEI